MPLTRRGTKPLLTNITDDTCLIVDNSTSSRGGLLYDMALSSVPDDLDKIIFIIFNLSFHYELAFLYLFSCWPNSSTTY